MCASQGASVRIGRTAPALDGAGRWRLSDKHEAAVAGSVDQCPKLGVERTQRGHAVMAEFDPEADLPSACQPLIWGGQKCDVPTPPLRIRAQQRLLLHSSLQRGSAISMTSYYRQRAHRIRDWSQ